MVKCKCENTYFARVNVNQFKGTGGGLHMSMHEIEPDHDIKIYQCINSKCGLYMMPPLNYFSSTEEDKELYAMIQGALEGKIIKPKIKHKPRRIQAGTAAFVGGESDSDNDGKFIPVG
jgi:hypothetical protein